ncbi:hypothetical protein [Blastococcus brunescens]|uniref:Uncharacterized protein n=1 Tax=Blastococcus brunescens TaxID=1564165 RepID=A0ABZ1B356_9ACTN|nr:hypothetical protein [Blastococcus sp. BMG 8361]WRL63784.1 hypothetical protein U6N30_29805 [Blastococcus sp. BMG 8361]
MTKTCGPWPSDTATLPAWPTVSPPSAGFCSSVSHATSTGAQRSPYVSGWKIRRSRVLGSALLPSWTNRSPVTSEIRAKAACTASSPPAGALSGRTT